MQVFQWKEHNITYEMVIKNNKHIENGSKEIWEFVLKLLDKAVENGYLKNEKEVGEYNFCVGNIDKIKVI